MHAAKQALASPVRTPREHAQAAPGERLLQSGRPLPAAARPAAAASLALAAPLRGGMTIKVKTLTGREIEVDIEPTDTVERIKERLEEKEGIAPDQQRLIYSGAAPSALSDDGVMLS